MENLKNKYRILVFELKNKSHYLHMFPMAFLMKYLEK